MGSSGLLCELDVMPLVSTSRDECILELVCDLAARETWGRADINTVIEAILARERLGSSVIHPGVAIPHARVRSPLGLHAALGSSLAGVDFPGAAPVHLIIVLVASEDQADEYVRVLARISRLIRRPDVREGLLANRDVGETLRLFG